MEVPAKHHVNHAIQWQAPHVLSRQDLQPHLAPRQGHHGGGSQMARNQLVHNTSSWSHKSQMSERTPCGEAEMQMSGPTSPGSSLCRAGRLRMTLCWCHRTKVFRRLMFGRGLSACPEAPSLCPAPDVSVTMLLFCLQCPEEDLCSVHLLPGAHSVPCVVLRIHLDL